ncbi:DUF4113 domain-containing protein [Leclercia sp. 119287]|nr:DUF4113 domain-containing protein [Leclercia sp. 119287]
MDTSAVGRSWRRDSAGQGIEQQWQMKREMLSPRYTTRFSDLLRVR